MQLGTKNSNWKGGAAARKQKKMSRIPEVNHRVSYVEKLPQKEDVYCMEVPGIHWFYANDILVHNCSYCYNARWLEMYPSDKVIRYRSAKDVVDEVRFVNPPFAYFQDSCFGVSLKWLKEFCKKYESLVIPFHCHMRPNQVTEERVNLLANVNCASIRIALESASDRLRKLIRRSKLAKEETIQASRILKKYRPGCQPISLMVQNMLAVPTSTIEDDLETLEFNIRLRPDYAWCSIYSPYPGTELGDYCVEHFLFDGNYSRVTDSFFDRSLLNFKEEYIEQTYFLQKIFHLCVEVGYMPDPKELNAADFPMLIHKIVRKQGDRRLYRGII